MFVIGSNHPCPGTTRTLPLEQLTESRVRQIVREEIEHLADRIEHALGARP